MNETVFKAVVALGGGAAFYFYGGWSSLLEVLLAFIIIDYISGVVASAIEGKLNSAIGLRGIAKKIFIFVMVAVGHLIDKAIGAEVVMNTAIFFYLANELISIIENSGRIGLPVPPAIIRAVEMLQEKSEV